MQIRYSFISHRDIILPLHYNSMVQGLIYRNIGKELASFLHDKAFGIGGRKFKLFTFSRILSRGRRQASCLNFGRKIEFVVASAIDGFNQELAYNMKKNRKLEIGRNSLELVGVEKLELGLRQGELIVTTLSPIVVYSTFLRADGSKYTNYYRTGDREFTRLIYENLQKKYQLCYGELEEGDFRMDLLGRERENIVYYRKTIIKGVSGKFKVYGPRRLLELGLATGFGSKNSQGFGLVSPI